MIERSGVSILTLGSPFTAPGVSGDTFLDCQRFTAHSNRELNNFILLYAKHCGSARIESRTNLVDRFILDFLVGHRHHPLG